MKKFVIPCLGLILLAGCDQNKPSETQAQATAEPQPTADVMCDQESMPGGWHEGEVSPEVEAAVAAVIAQMGDNVQLKSIRAVKSQIVSGVNYALEFDTQDGKIWHSVVYQTLDGKLTITQGATPGELCR